MKKITVLLSILILALGCEKPAPQENKEDESTSIPEPEVNTSVRFNILECEGTQNFSIEQTRTYQVDWYGITRVQKSVPQGWSADFSKETSTLTITAPATLSNAAEDGKIEFIAKGDGGEMLPHP